MMATNSPGQHRYGHILEYRHRSGVGHVFLVQLLDLNDGSLLIVFSR